MKASVSIDQLAEQVNDWCQEHGVTPANGQAGERMTVRNIRYYRTLGLLDPPESGGGLGFGEKHRLQLVAIRLLQAQGLPLRRIQELLFGRSLDELREVERRGLAELESTLDVPFRPVASESWVVTPLDDDFLIVSRRGRKLDPGLRQRLASLLNGMDQKTHRRC
jgi:DNA-binding transcriptional MerR regulator